MKVLDVTLFREGMQRNVETLMRLEEEMQMIRAATEELISLQESLKGEGGDAIRAFYRDCHLPLLQYFVLFKSQFESILQQMDSALNALEPAADGHIRESFLESEIEAGLSEIATLTGSLTDEANAIMDSVSDIVGLPHLDDSEVQQGVQDAKKKRDQTVTDLHQFDASQTGALASVNDGIRKMELWITDLERMFNEGLTDVGFRADQWSFMTRMSPLRADLAAGNSSLGGVSGLSGFNAPLTSFLWTPGGGMNPATANGFPAGPGMLAGYPPYASPTLMTALANRQNGLLFPTYAAAGTTSGAPKKEEPNFVIGGDSVALGKYGTVTGGSGKLESEWSGLNDNDPLIGGSADFTLIHGQMEADTDYVDARGTLNMLQAGADAKIDEASVLGVDIPLPLVNAEAKGLEYDAKVELDRNMPYLGDVVGGTGIGANYTVGDAKAYAGYDDGYVGLAAKASLWEGELNPTVGIPFTDYNVKLTFGASAGSVGGEARVGREFLIDLRFLVGGRFGIGVEKGTE
ncbi:hypothetical protein C772_00351 [Bhargavaea cecembensis DSE10]|uniref:LXG domain-containing protein n=1 Tax=Bhargavaea cecembensis DSE10 TaxID=1235279 RepID=M7P0B4_9BACL|nr:LXG domain-containing protein [Bhargavaea cecembensis]EMR07335.1 hypothetical protein C772_00351 [Bhargavaea cecembensis DSE10]